MRVKTVPFLFLIAVPLYGGCESRHVSPEPSQFIEPSIVDLVPASVESPTPFLCQIPWRFQLVILLRSPLSVPQSRKKLQTAHQYTSLITMETGLSWQPFRSTGPGTCAISLLALGD